jgi:sugar (pentulose or hexulose) kinase
MSNDFVISADFGTSSVKVAVVDAELNIVACVTEYYPLSHPAPDQAEQMPEDWWSALCRATAFLATKVPDLKNSTGMIVLCAQMCGLVCLDENGAVLRPCMVCVDKRAASLSRELIGGFPSFEGYRIDKLARWLRLANGAPGKNGMDPLGKMIWVRENEPEIYKRTAQFLDVKDWLNHRATGELTMTADSANLTWLMDTRPGKEGWSDSLIRQSGLDRDKLPKIVDGAEIIGNLTTAAATELGLDPSTQLLGGGSDVSMAAIGAGLINDGDLMINVSTSSWISGFFDRRIVNVNHAYATITSSTEFRPLLVATQESAGSAADWAAKTFSDTTPSKDGGYSEFYKDTGLPQPDDPQFLPWLAGEKTPVDDDRLRAGLFNLNIRHNKTAIKRAVLEGIAHNTAWIYSKVTKLKQVNNSGMIPLVGGMGMYETFVQNLANSIDRPIVTANPRFAGVLGAAALAAPSLGWADDVWDGAKICQSKFENVTEPQPEHIAESQRRQQKLDKLRRKLVKYYQSY